MNSEESITVNEFFLLIFLENLGSLENWDVEDPHIPKNLETFQINNFKNFSRENDSPDIFPSLKIKLTPQITQTEIDRLRKKSNFSPLQSPTRYEGSVYRISKYKQPKDFIKEGKKSDENLSEDVRKKINSKFFRFLVTYWMVKKFVRKLRENTFYRKPQWLKKYHLNILNDQVFFPEGRKSRRTTFFFRHIKSKIMKRAVTVFQVSKILKILLLLVSELKKMCFSNFHPTNKFRLAWEVVITILTFLYMVIIPIEIGFGDMETNFPSGMKNLFLSIFFMDMTINFNTSFHSKGQLINSKKKILMNYLSGRFFKDFLSISFPISQYALGYSTSDFLVKVCGFFYLLRIRNLSKAVSRFEDYCFSDENTSNLISFIRLIISILLFSHWSACVWKLVGDADLNAGWLHVYGVKSSNMWYQYIYSLYYVVVVTNTVGFGDISPQTIYEKGFTVLFILLACVIFAYTINEIGIILQNINKRTREFKKTMNAINGYMKFKNINFDLKIKVRNYLEYIWQAEKMQNLHETQEVINRLSKSLKEELLMQANGLSVKALPMFGNNFSDETVHKIVCEMKEINFTPEDIIYHEKETTDENLYIVHDGEIELFFETPNGKNIPLKVLKKGEYFGEVAFFTGVPRVTSAKSISFSSLFVIKKENFIKVVKENSEDYEKYCQIKDEIFLNKDFKIIDNKCPSCKKTNHLITDCPILHLTIDSFTFLEKYNFTAPQQRTAYLRRRQKKTRGRKNFVGLKIEAKKIIKLLQNETIDNINIESLDKYERSDSFAKNKESEPECEGRTGYSNQYEAEQSQNGQKGKSSFSFEVLTEESQCMDSEKPSMNSEALTIYSVKRGNACVFGTKGNIREEEDEESPKKGKSIRKISDKDKINQKIKTSETIATNGNKFCNDIGIKLAEAIDIDSGMNFEVYFPQYNIEHLIERINEMAIEKQKKLRNFSLFNIVGRNKMIRSSYFLKRNPRKTVMASSSPSISLKIKKQFLKPPESKLSQKCHELYNKAKKFCLKVKECIYSKLKKSGINKK